MINFNFRLIDPCGTEQDSYIKIHRELFKSADIDVNWIEWYHNRIRSSDPRLSITRTYGLYDGERLIGIWSVEPKMMRNSNNELNKVGRCFAVGISSDYRRMGLFVKLSEFAIQCERKRAEFEYIIGFPQTGRSVVGGHLKAGWEEIIYNETYSVDLKDNDGIYFRKDVNTVVDFAQINTPSSTHNSFDEPASYRNTRFLWHPKVHYMIFTFGDANIVLKPYSTYCHILDLHGSKDNVKRLIEVSKSVCKRHGLEEINVWNNSEALNHDALMECGFVSGAQFSLPITIIAVQINAEKKFQIQNSFNFEMGVEEGY
ncbi:hypothetical protein KAR48_05600 [bacterium]|nr:hypothetical protein [bacterium]